MHGDGERCRSICATSVEIDVTLPSADDLVIFSNGVARLCYQLEGRMTRRRHFRRVVSFWCSAVLPQGGEGQMGRVNEPQARSTSQCAKLVPLLHERQLDARESGVRQRMCVDSAICLWLRGKVDGTMRLMCWPTSLAQMKRGSDAVVRAQTIPYKLKVLMGSCFDPFLGKIFLRDVLHYDCEYRSGA